VEHSDRLTKPLKRVGERGEGKWKEISWDEALDFIEKRMKEIREGFGPESVIFSMGTGRDIGPWICMLAYAFGSPNVMFALSGNACYSPRIAAVHMIQGDYCVFDAGQWLPDRYDDQRFKVPECMIVWGYNIHATCPDNLFGHWIVDLMKRGTKIISVDPRLSWFASRSKKWLKIRHRTDSALAMGLLNVIINEHLFDRTFVERWTNAPHLIRTDTGRLLRECDLTPEGSADNFVVWDQAGQKPAIWDVSEVAYKTPSAIPALSGTFEIPVKGGFVVTCRTVWDAFCDEVNQYPLDKVEEITWVPAKGIAEAARLYATSKPVCCRTQRRHITARHLPQFPKWSFSKIR